MAARRAMEEFEINEAESTKAAKAAETAEAEAAEAKTDEKAAKTADTAVEVKAEADRKATDTKTTSKKQKASAKEIQKTAEETTMAKLAKRYELPRGVVEQMELDQSRYGKDIDEELFALSYYTEMNRARTGKGKPGDMTEYLPPEAAENARKVGEMLKRQDARAEESAKKQTDARKDSEEQRAQRATKKALTRRVHNRTGKSKKQLTEVQRAVFDACEVLAEAMDTEIVMYASSGGRANAPFGWFEPNGRIHIDINAEFDGKNVALFTLAHESVHFIKRYAPEDFRRIGETVVALLPVADADIKEMVDLKQVELEERGRLSGLSEAEKYDYAFEEVVADAMETVLADGKVLEELILDSRHGQKKNFWKKLLEHLDDFIRRLKELMHGARAPHGAGRILAQVEDSMRGVRDIYAKALMNAGEARRDASRMNSEKMHDADSQTSGIVRESFAGRNAHTADHMKLATAERMIAEGVDSETVRKETGWFKGYDGEWRFEIADPININATEMYENRFTTLGKLIYHPDLFSAYPDLADMRVTFEAMEAKGAYHRDFDTISLNDDFRKPFGAGGISETLTHEIQHAVQAREGFAHGASPDYWERQGGRERMVENARQKKQNIFDQAPDEFRQMVRKINRAVLDYDDVLVSNLLDEIYDSPYAELYKQYDMADFEYRAIKEKVDRGDFDPIELYYRTVGEVEARDSARRLGLSSGQRKNTRPDIDRTDVVFAEESSAEWHSGKNKKYDPETASIATQIRLHQDELNQMDIVASAKTPETFNRSYDAVQWAIEELQSTGYQVDRQGFGKVYFNPKDINKGANYANTNEERAAFAVLPKVIKRGIIIGDHNQHKQRAKNTITFAAPVELNGKRGNVGVVVNLNGNHYYAHRILLPDGSSFVFSDTKNEARQEPQRGVTETGSLANATSLASVNSIPQTTSDVNPTGENNSENGNRYSDRAGNPFEEAVRRSGIAEDSDGDGGVDAFTEALGRSGIGTDRYLLATALESTVANEREYSLLKKYKENLGRLESLSSELDSVNEELKRLTFTKGKRDGAAIKSLQERKQGLVDKISEQDKKLLSLEAAKPLRDILGRERKKARRAGKKEAEDKSRERRQSTDALNRRRVIVDIADRWLTLLEKPTKNRNIPKVMEPLVLDRASISKVNG